MERAKVSLGPGQLGVALQGPRDIWNSGRPSGSRLGCPVVDGRANGVQWSPRENTG